MAGPHDCRGGRRWASGGARISSARVLHDGCDAPAEPLTGLPGKAAIRDSGGVVPLALAPTSTGRTCSMNKSELVDAIAERTGVSKQDVDSSLRGLFEVVAGVVAKGGDKVTIPGFVSFEQSFRAARAGRNPATGETIQVAAPNTAKVSAASKLK